MKQFYLLIILITWMHACGFASPTDTTVTYYDEQWKETTSANAAYLRKAWQQNGLRMVNDYFKTGELQMTGAYSDDSFKVREGKVVYFHKNGQVSKSAFYVHDSAHGEVSIWYDNGQLARRGYFIHGKEEGLSTAWYKNGQPYDSVNYVNGRLNGQQVWFYENGRISEAGVYRNDTAISYKLYMEDGTPDPDGIPNILMPAFPKIHGQGLSEYLGAHLHYPEKARRKSREGRAILQFVVTSTGQVRNVELVKSSGTELLDAEAFRVVSGMPAWIPGKSHNRLVDIYFTLPVTFKLD